VSGKQGVGGGGGGGGFDKGKKQLSLKVVEKQR